MHCPASGIRGTVYPVVYGKFHCWLDRLTCYQVLLISGFYFDKRSNCNNLWNIIDCRTASSEMPIWQLQLYSTRGLYLCIFFLHYTAHFGLLYLNVFFLFIIWIFDHKQIPHIQEWVMRSNQNKVFSRKRQPCHGDLGHAGFILVKGWFHWLASRLGLVLS